MDELESAIRRFKSIRQHRDMLEDQYKKVRQELCRRFDELDLQEIVHKDTRVQRTHYRQFEYNVPLLEEMLDERIFSFITKTETFVVPDKFHQAVRDNLIHADVATIARTVTTQTDMIRIVKA